MYFVGSDDGARGTVLVDDKMSKRQINNESEKGIVEI